MAVKLSIMKDLGTRPIELTWLQIKDVDLKTGIVRQNIPKKEKGN